MDEDGLKRVVIEPDSTDWEDAWPQHRTCPIELMTSNQLTTNQVSVVWEGLCVN
jgi:hypothetical protein